MWMKTAFLRVPWDLPQGYIYYSIRLYFFWYYSVKKADRNTLCHFGLLPVSFTTLPSSSETDRAGSFHFFLFPLNFISEILAEVIYNLSGECLGNWKNVKNNNDDDNSREIKDRDGMFISKLVRVEERFCFRFFKHVIQRTHIPFPSSPLDESVVHFPEVVFALI